MFTDDGKTVTPVSSQEKYMGLKDDKYIPHAKTEQYEKMTDPPFMMEQSDWNRYHERYSARLGGQRGV